MTDSPDLSARQMWRVTIAAPIDTVWATITRTGEVLPFLFGAVCDAGEGLAPGRPMRMVSADGRNVIAYGQVLDFSPPHRFSHSITFTQVKGERPGRTTWELREVPGGTEVTLISEAVPGSRIGKMARTGQFILDTVKKAVESGKPGRMAAMIIALAPVAALFTPRRCRIGNWPLTAARIEAMNRGE
jgi:uncharacterized protein YndB with AHSA1/START domain